MNTPKKSSLGIRDWMKREYKENKDEFYSNLSWLTIDVICSAVSGFFALDKIMLENYLESSFLEAYALLTAGLAGKSFIDAVRNKKMMNNLEIYLGPNKN